MGDSAPTNDLDTTNGLDTLQNGHPKGSSEDLGRDADPSIDQSLDETSNGTSRGALNDSVTKGGLLTRIRSMVGAPGPDTESESLETQTNALANAPRTRRDMIERVIAFDEKRVFDVMLPRADIAAVEIETSMPDLIQLFSDAGHSRMPVYRNDLDDPVGMVHIKDLIGILAENGLGLDDPATRPAVKADNRPVLKNIVRKILYVPPSMRVVDLFLRMQASRIHMAVVIDEYGGTDGLVTIEDIIEEIVGEIHDEHDEDEFPMIAEHTSGGWDADARIELEELEAITGASLRDDEEDVETLGGLIFALAGRVPLRGEIIAHSAGLEFEILDADARKIRKLRIRPVSNADDSNSISA